MKIYQIIGVNIWNICEQNSDIVKKKIKRRHKNDLIVGKFPLRLPANLVPPIYKLTSSVNCTHTF